MKTFALLPVMAAAAGLWLSAPVAAAELGATRAERVVARQADALAAPRLGGGWVGLPARYRLAGARYETLVGTRDGAGSCEFDPHVSATPARPVQLARTRAVHLGRCLEILEIGVPPRDVVARYDAESQMAPGPDEATATMTEEAPNASDAQDEATPDVGVGDPSTPGFHADGSVATITPSRRADIVSQTGYYRAWFEDPVNLDVNVVRQELYWSHEGPTGCVRSAYSVLKLSQLEQTGWYRNGANKRLGYTCSRAFSSAYAKFTNQTFCRAATVISPIPIPGESLISPTRTFYNRAVARGFNTGKITGNTRHSKKGGCTVLLSFNGMARHYG